jgi:hypothetical protein
VKLTAFNPGFGSTTSGGGPTSYADLVCPPIADQPGIVFSALEVVNFLFGVLRVLHKHMSVKFLG